MAKTLRIHLRHAAQCFRDVDEPLFRQLELVTDLGDVVVIC